MEEQRGRMRVGELATKAGTTAKTIRYYEQIGLLPRPIRTEAGYRQYAEDAIERLAFIAKAKRLGLSLDEIRDVLVIWGSGVRPCSHVTRLIDDHIERVERTIEQLRELGVALRRIRKDAGDPVATSPESVCGLIEHAELPIEIALFAPIAIGRAGQRR